MSAECNVCGHDLVYGTGDMNAMECPVCTRQSAAIELAKALKQLVNAGLPISHDGFTLDLEPEVLFWAAARNARATLDTYADLTGINGEQEELRS